MERKAVVSRDQEPDSLPWAKDQIPKSQLRLYIKLEYACRNVQVFYHIHEDMDSPNKQYYCERKKDKVMITVQNYPI